MAILKTIKANNGLVAQDAYHRVENIKVTKHHLDFQVKSYSKNPQRITEAVDGFEQFMSRQKPERVEPFEYRNYSCPYDLNGDTPFAQAYAHMKEQPEFHGGVDI